MVLTFIWYMVFHRINGMGGRLIGSSSSWSSVGADWVTSPTNTDPVEDASYLYID